MLEVIILIIAGCIFAMYMGVFINNNIPDKVMSFNCVTNYIVVLICLFALYQGRESYIDIAYIYVLYGFMTNLVLTKLIYKNKK